MNSEIYDEILENIHDGLYCVDLEKKITYWNRAAEDITGYTKEEVIGVSCGDNLLRHIDQYGHDLCIFGCPLGYTLQDGEIREAQVYLHHKYGHRVPISVRIWAIKNEQGEIIGAAELFSTMTSNLEDSHKIKQLQSEVFRDDVTQIANRKLSLIKLSHRLQDLISYNITFGVLFVDIDFFKKVNDVYGHNTGDQVLLMVAKTIANSLRSLDIVTRWGGEEFMVIVSNIDNLNLYEIADRIRGLVESTWIMINNSPVTVTISIGATLARSDDTIDSLIERADALMYQSKKLGRNRVTIDDRMFLDKITAY